MKRIFLVDKENTGNRFIKGLDNLTSADMIIVFQWQQGGQIKEEVLEALAKCKASKDIIRFTTHTKNALDFQICTYLGILYGKYGPNAEYYIVSNDNGYKAAIEFMKTQIDNKATFRIIPDLSINKAGENELLNSTLEIYNRKVRSTVRQGIRQSSDIQSLHIFLQRNLSRDYRDIYYRIKPFYVELKAAC